MNKINIHNFLHFLKELEKNLNDMDDLMEQKAIRLKNIHVIHKAMNRLCKSLLSQLEHRR